MSNYAELLKDPRWQKKRLEILQRDDFKCRICHSKEKELHVHHRRYIPRRKPWDYDGESLVTLCIDHHKEVTSLKDRIGEGLIESHCWLTLAKIVDGEPENEELVGYLLLAIFQNKPLLQALIAVIECGWNAEAESFNRGVAWGRETPQKVIQVERVSTGVDLFKKQ